MATRPLFPALIWFRRNLRLDDNEVLHAASILHHLMPVFIWDPDEPLGESSRWWLNRSLQQFQKQFRDRGLRLILRKGDSLTVLRSLIRETDAQSVWVDRSYEPWQREKDAAIQRELKKCGIPFFSVNDSLLFDPATNKNQQGKPYQVFTPFWNQCLSLPDPALSAASAVKWEAPKRWPQSDKLSDWKLCPSGKWAKKLEAYWDPGSKGAKRVLGEFLKFKMTHYPKDRDRPDLQGTSRLSPYLHFGELSIRRVWHEVRRRAVQDRKKEGGWASEVFLRQLVWREFAAYLLFHFPEMISQPLRKDFLNFSWRKKKSVLQKWQEGKTGYPIVDAGMRELWATGWMHNRVRMIVASFLIKDLLQPWRDGARWFEDTLVDADLANNTFGWQWTAGCGADAAPYFRIFNPVLQGEKFDPEGRYVRQWIPELSRVPARYLHQPWQASPEVLRKAGVQLGQNYPRPMVHHDDARKRALFIYSRMRRTKN